MTKPRSPLGAAIAAQILVFVLLVSIVRAQNVSQAPAPENAAAGAAPSGGGELQQVVVTGYLIPRIGEGPQPVTSYDQQYIKNTGYQNITDVLQTLPSATGNFNPAVTSGFSFSPASASIALKGLPPNDTLVLVDGLRMPSYPFPQQSTAGAFNFVDINSIPLAAIDRIEILNDGGSATYGTDAVAGVVNLILKDQYQGADINNYFGISQRGDYQVYHGQFVAGVQQYLGPHGGSGGEPAAEGKTPVVPEVAPAFVPKITLVAAFDFYDQSPVLAKDRAFTDENFSRLSFRYPDHGDFPTTTGLFVDTVTGNAFQPVQGFNGVNPTPADFTAPYNTFTSAKNGLMIYPRETRVGGVVKLTADLTPWLKLYDTFLISRNEEVSSYGPNQGIYPPPFNPGIIVPGNNPFNPFPGHPLLVIDSALNEFGLLDTDTTITTFRNVVGATIQLPHSFYIDSNYLYGESDATETMKNMFTFNGMEQALSGTLPGNVGQFLNPFADEFVAGPNRAFYGNKNLIGSIWEDIRSSISQFHTVAGTTDLFDLPSGSIAVAGGFEYRSEDYIQNDDPNSKSGNLTAIQFPVGRLINARRYIWSIFGEVDIPLAGNQWSFPGLRSLQMTISDRQDYYSDFGSAAKPKFALLYKPFNDFTVQASYDESFVAPSLPQLFTVAGLPAETLVIDPKFPQNGQETVLSTTFGNPHLKPETAYMYYVRGIWTPGSSDPEHSWWGWLNGFSAYIDWFQLDQHQVFGVLTPQEIVNLGSAAPPGNFVTRSAITGQIVNVTSTYLNLGNLRSEGVEWGFTYNTKEYNWGKLEFSYDATYLYSVKAQTVQGLNPNGTLFFRVFDDTDVAEAGPDLKMQASLFYSKTVFGIDTFRTGVTWHYIGSELDFNNSANGTNPPVPIGSFSPDQGIPGNIHTIGSWSTWDWQISYKFGQPSEITPQAPKPGYDKEGKKIIGEKAIAPVPEGGHASFWRTLLANTTITFGINNIFDTRPPLSVDNVITNFDPASGASFVQRYFWFSIDKKF